MFLLSRVAPAGLAGVVGPNLNPSAATVRKKMSRRTSSASSRPLKTISAVNCGDEESASTSVRWETASTRAITINEDKRDSRQLEGKMLKRAGQAGDGRALTVLPSTCAQSVTKDAN